MCNVHVKLELTYDITVCTVPSHIYIYIKKSAVHTTRLARSCSPIIHKVRVKPSTLKEVSIFQNT